MTALSRFRLVALGIPVTVTAAAVATQLVLLPRVADQVAIHWNGAGTPDDFGPAWSYPVLTLAVALVLPLLLALPSLKQLADGATSGIPRFLGATCAGMSVMFSVLMTWSLGMQVGISDPAAAPSVVVPLLVSLAVGLAVGALAWRIQPAAVPGPLPTPAEPMKLRRGAKVTWVRTTTMNPVVTAALIVSCLLLVILTIWVALTGGTEILLVAPATVAVIVLTVCTVAFTVRVDRFGLSVDSPVGFPRIRIPLTDIDSAAAIETVPLTDFGGWGIRRMPGATGVILRGGPALEVRKEDGTRFVVTVADPQQAASLLMGLLARS